MSGPENLPAGSQSNTPQELEYVVRFGAMRSLGVMTAKQPFRYADEVVAKTTRGTEIGTVLCEATPAALDAMKEPTEGSILRLVADNDRSQADHLDGLVRDDLAVCQRCVDGLRLDMELVDVERVLGGERVIVYFLAEQRVDFRQLVRDLAREFQTRIEMRQIGVRDEAKLLADYGDCGQPICCATFLSKMPPVSMKMAKIQRATLDPTKISGRCGRLKCCLRYEFETYEQLSSELPPIGSTILTRDGSARVLNRDILSQQLMIETSDKRRVLLPVADVIQVQHRGNDADRERSPKKPRKRQTRPRDK